MVWGFHLILDGKNAKGVSDKNKILDFIKNFVPEIGMESWGQPILMWGNGPTPEEAGYTLIQPITTSSITIHFVDKSGDFYMDIFSCKPFDTEKAERFVQDTFQPEELKRLYLER